MKIVEAKKIVSEIELTQAALDRANELLAGWGTDETELADEMLDQLIAIIDTDIAIDMNIAKTSEDMAAALRGFVGETGQRAKMAGDEVEAAAKNMYEEVKKDQQVGQ